MDTDGKIVKMLEDLQTDVKSLHNKVDTLDQGQKALQADVKTLDSKIDRVEDGQGVSDHGVNSLKINDLIS
jgi:peptidoglycan hydrolase CwlO-like protein